MSSKNIFEVLQKIAENPESDEKFLNILKENGFTGTLEEAKNQINQQTQVVLDNLTTEDLQNIAGGKSLMNDKLKKAIAVGGASLMAAGAGVQSGSAQGMNKVKKTVTGYANEVVDYVKENPAQTAVTGALALGNVLLLTKLIFGGKNISGLSFMDKEGGLLGQIDLSEKREVCKFIEQLSDDTCELETQEKAGVITIKFNKTKEDVLHSILKKSGGSDTDAIEFTAQTLLLQLIATMDKDHLYVDSEEKLTATGAKTLNILAPYIVKQINTAVVEKATADEQTALEQAERNVQDTEKKLKAARQTLADAKAKDPKELAKNAEKQAQQKLDVAKQTLKEAEEKAESAEDKEIAGEQVEQAKKDVEQAKKDVEQAKKDVEAATKKVNDTPEDEATTQAAEAEQDAQQNAKEAKEKFEEAKKTLNEAKNDENIKKLEPLESEFEVGDSVKPETKSE